MLLLFNLVAPPPVLSIQIKIPIPMAHRYGDSVLISAIPAVFSTAYANEPVLIMFRQVF
jgi:hypothetical protein